MCDHMIGGDSMRKMRWLAMICGLIIEAGSSWGQTVLLDLVPSSQQVQLGTPTTVAMKISGLGDGTAPSLGTFDLDLTFDPAILSCTSATFGDPILGDQLDLRRLGSRAVPTPGDGVMNLFELSLDSPDDLNTLQVGAFILATITCDTLALGTSPLRITVHALGDALGVPLTASVGGGSVEVIAPDAGLCILHLEASFAEETLTLNFELGTQEPATWNVWLIAQAEVTPVVSAALPVIEPPASVELDLPFLPAVGTVGFLTTLTTPVQGIICSAFVTVDTGPSGPAAATSPQVLQDRLAPSVKGLHDQLLRQHIR
jgi:hypothetical protein